MGRRRERGENGDCHYQHSRIRDSDYRAECSRFYDFRFQVVVSVPGGKDRRAAYAGGPGVVAGRVDPLVLPLIPGASYAVQIPLVHFVILDGPENLETLILKRCQVRLELDVQNFACPLYGYPNPNMIPCWQGKIVSNVLQLPN
jgi:hypothetical protein